MDHLKALEHSGLAKAVTGPDGQDGITIAEALMPFAPLLSSFNPDLRPMTTGECPVKFWTGIVSVADGAGASPVRLPAGGQGLTDADAVLSCLGELAERISLCRSGRVDRISAAKPEKQPMVDYFPILGFSPAQAISLEQFKQEPASHRGSSAPHRNEDEDWVDVVRLDGRTTGRLPPEMVFLDCSGPLDRLGPGLTSTSGCAVWTDRAGARERALLELAERDAVAQMWYNRLGITRVENRILQEKLDESLTRFLANRSRQTFCLAVDTDLPVHIAVSISCSPDGKDTALGAGAGWTFVAALQSAATEMLQSENSLRLMDKAYMASTGKVPSHLAYARGRSVFDDLPLQSAPMADSAGLMTEYSFAALLDDLAARDFQIWEFDATRDDLKIPCVKLFSADLCSWQPRFGKERLFQGVVDRGWRQQRASEEEFAARPFPF